MTLLATHYDIASFVKNDRGILIHRPIMVQQYKLTNYPPHLAVKYYCNGGANGDKNFTFINHIPEGMLLCHACESRAVIAGQKSASEICGKHVHTGKMIAVQQCCVTTTQPEDK
jgi:hypothetical protein